MNGPDMMVPLPSSGPRSSPFILRRLANGSLKALPSERAEGGMEFWILGPMEVFDGPRAIRLPAGRARALLALLLLNAGEVLSAERIVDELWGERPPPTASTVVQGHVSTLRKALGRATVETVGSGYRMAAADVDADRFRMLLDQARDSEAENRAQLLRRAQSLWRGPALADFTYEPFAQGAITALEELRLAALEDRIDAELALGRTGLVAE